MSSGSAVRLLLLRASCLHTRAAGGEHKCLFNLCLRACACLPAHAFRYPYTHDHARHNSNRLIHTNICIRARKHTHTHTHTNTLRFKRQKSHKNTSAKNPNTICALCHVQTCIHVQTKYAQKHTNIFKLADTYISTSMCVCVCVCVCTQTQTNTNT